LADNSIEAATPTRARDSQWIIDASFVHLVMSMYRHISQNLWDMTGVMSYVTGGIELEKLRLIHTKLEFSLHILLSLTLQHSHEIK
jgi:hypothetical protein